MKLKESMQPLVSILVPVYGVEKYIEKCCRSLFEQTYENIEYIFIDDCTKDNSVLVLKNVLEEYPERKERVKIIKHEQNKGVSGARNTGLEFAAGEYLMFVDSDDYLDSDAMECLVKKALDEKADITAFDMRYVYPDKSYIVHQHIEPDPVLFIRQLLLYKVSVCVCGNLYKSTLFKDNIRFIEGIDFGEDYATSPRIAYYAHKIAHCDSCCYNYVQYNTSSCTTAYKSKNIDDLLEAVEILADFFNAGRAPLSYRETLNGARLLCKIKLIIAVCLHRKTVGHRLSEICGLYGDIKSSDRVPVGYRIILWLANKRFYKLLLLYVREGFKIKQKLKR
jgi:glycosyltransferase involved in cell wall biosynthesis